MLVLVFLTTMASGSHFRGGGFVQGVLIATLGLQMIALVSEVRSALQAADGRVSNAGSRRMHGVLAIGAAGLILLTYMFGFVVGFSLFLMPIWLGLGGFGWRRAIIATLIFGVGIPLLFAWSLDLTLWAGVVPEVLPGFIGGSIAPPL